MLYFSVAVLSCSHVYCHVSRLSDWSLLSSVTLFCIEFTTVKLPLKLSLGSCEYEHLTEDKLQWKKFSTEIIDLGYSD